MDNEQHSNIQNPDNLRMVQDKNGNKNIVVAIIGILLILALSGYIVYDKFIANNDIEEKTDEDRNDLITVDINEEKIKSSISDIKRHLFSDEAMEELMYGGDEFNLRNLQSNQLVKKALLSTAILLTNKTIPACADEGASFTIDELNNALRKRYPDMMLTFNDLENMIEDESFFWASGFYVVISENTIKVALPCGYEGNPFEPFTVSKIIKAEKNNEYLYIYEKMVFGKGGEEGADFYPANYLYCKNTQRTNIIEILDESYMEELKWDQYNTYKYIFKIENGNYYFERIELVK